MRYTPLDLLDLPDSAVFYDPKWNRHKGPYLETNEHWTPFGKTVAIAALAKIHPSGDSAQSQLRAGSILPIDYFVTDKNNLLSSENIAGLFHALRALELSAARLGRLEGIDYYVIAMSGNQPKDYSSLHGIACSALEDAGRGHTPLWFWEYYPKYLLLNPQEERICAVKDMNPFSYKFFEKKKKEVGFGD